MRVQIACRHCEVSERLKERAEARVRKLERYEPRVQSAEIVFSEERHVRKVEGILSIAGAEPVVAQGEGGEFREAIDQMTDRLGKILRRAHAQRVDHKGPRRTAGERTVGD